MSKMPCSITDDPMNDYSHWIQRTGPHKIAEELMLHQCEGCHLLVDRLDDDLDLCSDCVYEYQQEKFYKYAPDNWVEL